MAAERLLRFGTKPAKHETKIYLKLVPMQDSCIVVRENCELFVRFSAMIVAVA